MPIKIIYARDLDHGIGKDNDLPWPRLPADMRHFRNLTKAGQAVIMGRKTWESLPADNQPLPGRLNIVLSRNADFKAEGAEVHSSLEAALGAHPNEELFVIGGAALYREAMPLANVIYETVVNAAYRADTTLEPVDLDVWVLQSSVERQPDAKNKVLLHFNTYVRPPAWLAAAKGG